MTVEEHGFCGICGRATAVDLGGPMLCPQHREKERRPVLGWRWGDYEVLPPSSEPVDLEVSDEEPTVEIEQPSRLERELMLQGMRSAGFEFFCICVWVAGMIFAYGLGWK